MTIDPEAGAQPRPNVLIEVGYAMGLKRDKTLIVSVGDIRPISDLAGMHVLRLNDSPAARNNFANRLGAMRLPIDTSGQDWFTAGKFVL